MAWFNKKPKQEKIVPVKEDIWTKCRNCGSHVYKKDYDENMQVCPRCNYHERLTAWQRIDYTLDKDSFKEMFESIRPNDPLRFTDNKGNYGERCEAATKKTGLNDSVITGTGKINGIPVAVAVMDFRFMGGSLGSVCGEKILRAANVAYDKNLPYIIFSASGGARMQEGALSLMQMAKTCAAIARLNEKKIPYISVLTNPTYGGVTASYAMVGDVNIAEPGALIGFAGRRVIEQTIKQNLPYDFQTAEYQLNHGFVDTIVAREDLKNTLATILSYHTK